VDATREHDLKRLVYRSSMFPALAALLISAWTSEPGIAAAQTTAPPITPPDATESAASAPPPDTSPAAPPGTTPAATAETPAATAQGPGTEPDSAPVPPLVSRLEAYEQFRAFYDTNRFAEALPFAKQVVELSGTGPEGDYDLPIAYNNLGATQFQLGDYAAAGESYRQSLELLEASQGISSRRLIVPLYGLANVHAKLDQHAIAVDLFSRALAVSRRSEGLFNLAQLPLIESSAESLFALGNFDGVQQERLYALKIAEQNFGYNDQRTLPAVLQLANFYESVHEFGGARAMYFRARDISIKESGGFNSMAIRSLIGIARTQRLQMMTDTDPLDERSQTRDEITGEIVPSANRASYVITPNIDRSGIKSAQTALEILRAASDPPRDLLTETLIELGDWYQSTSRSGVSVPYYAEAASLLASNPDPSAANPLQAPRLVVYRPPIQSARSMQRSGDDFVIRTTVFSLGVSNIGEPLDIKVLESDMSEGQLSQSRRAIARAIYSPRFVDGKAVATKDVIFTAEWYEQRQPAKEATDPAAPTKPPTAPASSAG
jgi:tetratricopeptide (TPR) repeat protein